MNPRKVDEYDYIQFLLAAQRVFSTVEAAKVVSGEDQSVAHNAYTRLLQRIPPDSGALWQEVENLVTKAKGLLVIGDTTLDKPYAEKMAMVTSHWSGKHHAVVSGINLVSPGSKPGNPSFDTLFGFISKILLSSCRQLRNS